MVTIYFEVDLSGNILREEPWVLRDTSLWLLQILKVYVHQDYPGDCIWMPRRLYVSFQPFIFVFQNVHQGYPTETLVRFLKAREWNVHKARKMVTISTGIFPIFIDES